MRYKHAPLDTNPPPLQARRDCFVAAALLLNIHAASAGSMHSHCPCHVPLRVQDLPRQQPSR
jgi:hypothetical protein